MSVDIGVFALVFVGCYSFVIGFVGMFVKKDKKWCALLLFIATVCFFGIYRIGDL